MSWAGPASHNDNTLCNEISKEIAALCESIENPTKMVGSEQITHVGWQTMGGSTHHQVMSRIQYLVSDCCPIHPDQSWWLPWRYLQPIPEREPSKYVCCPPTNESFRSNRIHMFEVEIMAGQSPGFWLDEAGWAQQHQLEDSLTCLLRVRLYHCRCEVI